MTYVYLNSLSVCVTATALHLVENFAASKLEAIILGRQDGATARLYRGKGKRSKQKEGSVPFVPDKGSE